MGVGKNVVVFMVKRNCTTATIRFLYLFQTQALSYDSYQTFCTFFFKVYRELRPDGDRVPGNEASKVPLKLGRSDDRREGGIVLLYWNFVGG